MPRKRPRDRGGRPSKFTTGTALAIVADIAGGTPREEAARSAGVGVSTFYRWLQKGRAGDPRYAPALTLAALTSMSGPKHYVDYWMRAAGYSNDHIFRLYVALFLLDLMSEHGHAFNGNERPSTPEARAILLDALTAETAILADRS